MSWQEDSDRAATVASLLVIATSIVALVLYALLTIMWMP